MKESESGVDIFLALQALLFTAARLGAVIPGEQEVPDLEKPFTPNVTPLPYDGNRSKHQIGMKAPKNGKR